MPDEPAAPGTAGGTTLHRIALLGLPVGIHQRSSERSDELRREFTYLRAQESDPDSPGVPTRLLRLIDELQDRYGGFASGMRSDLDAATARGEPTIDLVLDAPAAVAESCIHLGDLLAEADRYCSGGTHFLTLAAPPDELRYREWFLGEFVRQIAGEAPRRWAEDEPAAG